MLNNQDSINSTNNNYYFMSNQVDSTNILLDTSENNAQTNTFTPYGKLVNHTVFGTGSNLINDMTYTGREQNNGVDSLLYYRNRYYNSSMKRFISEDPIGLQGGINQYAYVEGNPMSFSDPSGNKLYYKGTDQEIAYARQAYNYLHQSPTATKIITNLEKSETDYVIDASFINKHDYFDPTTNIVHWNPLISVSDNKNQCTITPALGLAHELGHADYPADQLQKNGFNYNVPKFYDNMEEYRVVVNVENVIARELGEYIRKSHIKNGTIERGQK